MENGNEILVSGNVTQRQTRTLNLYSSQDFFMRTFAERLRAAGVRCLSDSLYAFGELTRDSLATLLAVHETSAQRVLDEMLKESDNLNAEAVFYRLGAHHTGSKHIRARDAQKAVRKLIGDLGLNALDYRLADGCGLSHYDYISPELLVTFLRYAYGHTDIFRKLYKALPVGGVDGTLKHRMRRHQLPGGILADGAGALGGLRHHEPECVVRTQGAGVSGQGVRGDYPCKEGLTGKAA